MPILRKPKKKNEKDKKDDCSNANTRHIAREREQIMNPQVESVKSDFEQTTGRLLKNLAETPDEKLNWSPASSARTPLDLGFHCADIIGALHGSLAGLASMPQMTTEQIDQHCRAQEKTHGSKEDVIALIEKNSSAYVTWLEGLSDEKLAATWQSPFGEFPLAVGITFPVHHTAGHVAQLEYIQTIYGDRVWH
jgi:hypothetical protein